MENTVQQKLKQYTSANYATNVTFEMALGLTINPLNHIQRSQNRNKLDFIELGVECIIDSPIDQYIGFPQLNIIRAYD